MKQARKNVPGPRQAALLIALLVGFYGEGQAAGRRLALLTRVRGDVTVQGVRARLLAAVQEHQHLRLAPQAQASLSYCAGGLRVHLTGPCEVEVTSRGVTPTSDHVRIVHPLSRATALLDEGVSRDVAGGARAALASDPVLLTVGTVYGPPRLMWWTTQAEPNLYAIKVYDPDGRVVGADRKVQAQVQRVELPTPGATPVVRYLCSCPLPQTIPPGPTSGSGGLRPQVKYRWVLQRPGTEAAARAEARFVLATPGAAAEASREDQRVAQERVTTPEDETPATERVVWYLGKGAYANAAQVLSEYFAQVDGRGALWQHLLEQVADSSSTRP